MADIPALNYTIHHAIDRLLKQHDYYQQELLKTRAFMIGDTDADPNLVANYGVISASDPATHLAGGTDPLAVSVNAENQLTIDVNPGTAVMPSGCWISLHSAIRQVTLAESAVDTPNVIYLQYLLDTAPDEPNRFQDLVSPYTLRIGDQLNDGTTLNTQDVLIGVLTAETYAQLSQSVLDDIVPLAVATVQNVDTGGGVYENQLTVDHTTASYDYNRPWFSMVDNYHRSQVGTGTVTPTNPHGQDGNDLSIGDLSMLQTQLDHGMVIAKDRSIAKVPGYRCTSARMTVLTDDASGTLTGFANASYIELPYFPVAVGKIWDTSTSEILAGVQVAQTHRIVFPYETITASVSAYYTRAEVAEPPLPGNTVFRTNGPGTQELPIAGGVGLVSLTTTEEDFSDASRVPMRYEVFMGADGTLRKTPQVVYCYNRLEDLGTSDTPEITPYGPGRLMVGLLDATYGGGLDVQYRVYGTDTTGAAIDELFTFNQTSWGPNPAAPANPEPLATFFLVSTNTFATITSINQEMRAGDGVNSALMIWMAQHPYSNYDEQADALHAATVDWNGYAFGNVFDKRVVGTTVQDELTAAADARLQEMIYNLLAGGNLTIYVDDFQRPRYHSLETPDELGDALGERAPHYPTYNFTKQQVGLHGYYRSIAFPVNASSGDHWRISLFGAPAPFVDPWFENRPLLSAYDGATWTNHSLTPVAGVAGTWEVTLTATPVRVQVLIYPGQCTGMAIYG